MAEYQVRWVIDVEASTPKEAAIKARRSQVREGTTATVFDVYDSTGTRLLVTIDTAGLTE